MATPTYYILFEQLENARGLINKERALRGEKSVLKKAFASFLSEERANVQCPIRQSWLDKCEKISNGSIVKGIKDEQVGDIIAAIKRAFNSYKIKAALPERSLGDFY